MKKFDDVEIEKDTKIISVKYINIEGYDCRCEVWNWDGVIADSLIFYKYDFKKPYEISVIKIIESYINENYDDSKHTLKIDGNYIFFNYNFEIQ